MKNIVRIAWLPFLVMACMQVAVAQKVGTTSMQFLKVMPCARATALGDAYSVWASGAEAVFWNPSGVALVQNQELSSTYVDWIFDARQGALSYAASLGTIGALGLQVQYVDYGEFEETSLLAQYMQNAIEPGVTGRTFRPFAYVAGITYARSLTDKFSAGLTMKYVHESLFNGEMATAVVEQGQFQSVKTWGSGLLFDFGIRYNTGFRSIQIGAAVQNFGQEITYARQSSLAPLLFRFGTAADLVGKDPLLLPDEDNRLSLAFDLFQPNDYDQQEHVGLEYEYAGVFALRAGYKFHYDTEGLTLGGGIKHTIGSVQLAVDYSYGSVGTYLGHVQRISLGAIIQ